MIRVVLKKFTDKNIAQLPNMTSMSRMALEACHIVGVQVAKAIIKEADTSDLIANYLHSDGITKLYNHYYSFQLTTSEGESVSDYLDNYYTSPKLFDDLFLCHWVS